MKTLKILSIIVVLAALATVAPANSINETKFEVATCDDLTCSIQKMVKHDFSKYNNYFYKNDVNRLKEKVNVVFFINNENEIKVLSTNCKNKLASEYIQQLLNGTKVKADEVLVNKKFRLDIKLDYRT